MSAPHYGLNLQSMQPCTKTGMETSARDQAFESKDIRPIDTNQDLVHRLAAGQAEFGAKSRSDTFEAVGRPWSAFAAAQRPFDQQQQQQQQRTFSHNEFASGQRLSRSFDGVVQRKDATRGTLAHTDEAQLGVDRMKITAVLNGSDSSDSDNTSGCCATSIYSRSPSICAASLSPSISSTTSSPPPFASKHRSPSRHRASRHKGSRQRGSKGQEPRDPRYKYTEEQGHFLWYYRTDLHLPWPCVKEEFEKCFGHERNLSGLQCKYYRVLGIHQIEKVREQTKWGEANSGEMVGKFGLVSKISRRYAWMRPEHR